MGFKPKVCDLDFAVFVKKKQKNPIKAIDIIGKWIYYTINPLER